MTSEPLRAALTGAGGFGNETLRALCQAADVQVVGVCDQDSSAAQAAADDANCPAYTDSRRLLVETRPDAVFVALPPLPAAELTRLACQRHVHVWRETPLGRNLEEAVGLFRAMEEAELCLAVGTQRRFMAGYRKARQWVDRLGKVSLLQAHYYFNAGPVRGWRGDHAAGGGTLMGLGYQMFDLVIWMLGLPESVYCQTHTGPRDASAGEPVYDTEDSAACLLAYPDKSLAAITLSRRHHPASEGLTLFGQAGSLLAEPSRCILRDRNGALVDQFEQEYQPAAVFERQVQAYIQAVRAGGGMYECSGRENLLNAAAIEAAYLSDRTNQPESPAALLASFDLRPKDCLTLSPAVTD